MKKILSRLFFPVPLVLELALLGYVLRRWTRFKKTGSTLLFSAPLLLWLFSTPFLPHALMRGLERMHPPYQAPGLPPAPVAGSKDRMAVHPPREILVLGQSLWNRETLPASSRMNNVFLSRIVEAVRIQRLHPEARILLSIGGVTDPCEADQFLSELADILSFDPGTVQVLHGARDTREELDLALAQGMSRRPVLVTSASHLARAMRLAQHRGLSPVPAPCDYMLPPYVNEDRPRRLWHLFPNAGNLLIMERVVYEYLGHLYITLRR